MGIGVSKQDRIGARVPHEVYETLCRAAEFVGRHSQSRKRP